jgi:Zn-dependent metalloprotease
MRGFVCLIPTLVCACRGGPSLPQPAGTDPALAAIERDTGHSWTIRWQEDLPTAAFLEGESPPWATSISQAEAIGRSFILKYGGVFGLGADDELALRSAELDELGMIHVALSQRRGRIPVRGGELRLHFDASGALVRANGRSIPIGALPLIPNHSAVEAQAAALLDARSYRDDVDPTAFSSDQPVLSILPLGSGEAHLAWRVPVSVEDGRSPMVLETWVDADDGSIVERNDTLWSLVGSGQGVFGERQNLTITEQSNEYWLEDPSRGDQKTYSTAGRAHLPGTGVHSDDPSRWDLAAPAAGAAVDAHAFVARSWDYFRDVHGRAGWDGQGRGVHATVHFGLQLAGAFCDGRQLIFGDGSDDLSPPAGALDVVAHEFTHGLISATAQLEGTGESGALAEAIADLFGCFVSMGSTPGGDWQIGETVYHPAGAPRPIRDLADPHATGNPSVMEEWMHTGEDGGAIHHNSTVLSHAGYLMSQGGSGVVALGPDATARIWYRALTRYLTAEAKVADAADATVAAARDFGRGEEISVRAAWVAVGVL